MHSTLSYERGRASQNLQSGETTERRKQYNVEGAESSLNMHEPCHTYLVPCYTWARRRTLSHIDRLQAGI